LVDAHRNHPAWKADPRPVCFNEDSTSIANLNAAAASHASWGLYDDMGHQTVWPANWQIWAHPTAAFFDRVGELVGCGSHVEREGMVVVEAEHFTDKAPDTGDNREWHVQRTGGAGIEPDPDGFHPGASGDAYVECLPDTRTTHDDPFAPGSFYNDSADGARLEYPISFKTTGTYYVWVRVNSTGTEDNGLQVGVDGKLADAGKRVQWCGPEWRWTNAQRDSGGTACGVNGTIHVEIDKPGTHVITLYQREDGAEVDRFILTTDKKYDPSDLGIGPAESVRTGPRRTLSLIEAGRYTPAIPRSQEDGPDGSDMIWIAAATDKSLELQGAMRVGTDYAGGESRVPDADPEADSLVGKLLFVDADNDDGQDIAAYTVNLPNDGTWWAWGRFYYPGKPGGNDPNCFWIRVDDSPEQKFGNNRYDRPSYRQWHWDGNGNNERGVQGLRLGRLSAGKHTLRIRNREADRKIGPRLDVILLTNNSRYVPSDEEASQSIHLK
jgi:hypothetical protein